MKVGVITETVPHLFHGGGDLTAYAVIRSLREAGHDVSLLSLTAPEAGTDPAAAQIAEFSANGVPTTTLESRSRRRILGRIIELRGAFPISIAFPALRERDRVKEWIAAARPDVVFCYHWAAAASVYGIRSCPIVVAVGDPADLPIRFRRAFLADQGTNTATRPSLRQRVEDRVLPALQRHAMKQLLRNASRCGAFAAHHAREMSTSGTTCEYFRTPVLDPGERRRSDPEPGKIRILHIGHLKGIATLTGLQSLAEEILPRLEKNLPEGALEVRIVGGFYDTLPRSLKEKLARPSVRIMGPVYPADEELERADVVIVPTPIELGIRVRILTALAHSCCIVAHRANALGIPELVSGENCILGSTGAELADACIKLANDRTLSDMLRSNARATYLRYFSMENAGRALTKVIEEAAGEVPAR